jgi:hypothetical protein
VMPFFRSRHLERPCNGQSEAAPLLQRCST